MPKRNLLRTVHALDKSGAIPVYAECDWWEAWECYGDGDNVDDWVLAGDGTLDECIQALTNVISFEVNAQIKNWDFELSEWEKMQDRRRAEIRKQCLTTGFAGTKGSWDIRASLTAERILYQRNHLFERHGVDPSGFAPNPSSKKL
ncbi:hypothetical protein C7Y66_14295 [Chroococcidiopsis sp. CCALA 051]|uniref:hypothetical protein n=1 Tax=Chroococcidiopsis sp. CCALA 051 TaxID=869949 RepID=UPI000D0D87A5|nr:hypothetical protein [Chroococcidiopsis sp. CCALA 051]PSM48478.1 hypothetical protein C7Y66_14295 [Chroococcidiopsis sp. CCALA 051]